MDKKNAASLMAIIYFSETFAERRAIFLTVRKTVTGANAIKTREKLLSTDLVNTNNLYCIELASLYLRLY